MGKVKKRETIKFVALIKKVEIKALVTGDKSGRLTLETLYPEDVDKLAEISKWLEGEIIIVKVS